MTSRRAERASQASPRQAERHAAFIPAGRLHASPSTGDLRDNSNDTATDARHEARNRDIFLGDLVDRAGVTGRLGTSDGMVPSSQQDTKRNTDCRPVMSGQCDPTSGGSKWPSSRRPQRESC